MSAEFAKCECRACGRHIEFPIEGVGTTIDCPACGQETVLYASQPSAPDVSAEDIAQALQTAITGPINQVRVSLFYQLGMMLVAIMMVLLPVLYIAFIGLVGWSVYWFGVHFRGILVSNFGGVRIYLIKLIFYFGTLFAGAITVLFMLKPLFARRVKGAEPLALNPAVERSLYAFIARISNVTGAPMPTRIDLDCHLNASAGFRRGFLSFFGNDLVLTLGLPLIAGMNTRELAGVIAHEFGHFTQGFAMRLKYIVDSVDRWFMRVVYERDAWDVWLVSLSEETDDGWVAMVIGAAQLAVWASRRVLQVLMLLGHSVSCFLCRQMEYSADQYQIQVAGSAVFERAFIKMHILGAAANSAYKDMRTVWNISRQLPDDFSACLLEHEQRMPLQTKQRIEDTIGFGKTGWFDTHPSVADRVRRARQAAAPGVFQLEVPASKLFAAFDVVSKQVTCLHYSDDLGIPLDRSMLKPVGAMSKGMGSAVSE